MATNSSEKEAQQRAQQHGLSAQPQIIALEEKHHFKAFTVQGK